MPTRIRHRLVLVPARSRPDAAAPSVRRYRLARLRLSDRGRRAGASSHLKRSTTGARREYPGGHGRDRAGSSPSAPALVVLAIAAWILLKVVIGVIAAARRRSS